MNPDQGARILVVFAEWMDGNTMSDATRQRVDRALRAWNDFSYDLLAFCGGIFAPRQTIPAAEVMREYAVAHGVPLQRILCENRSVDTYENVRFLTKKILMIDWALGAQKHVEISYVTDIWHMVRVGRILEAYGHKRISCLPVWSTPTLKQAMTERIGLALLYLDPYGTGRIAKRLRRERVRFASFSPS